MTKPLDGSTKFLGSLWLSYVGSAVGSGWSNKGARIKTESRRPWNQPVSCEVGARYYKHLGGVNKDALTLYLAPYFFNTLATAFAL